MKQTRGSLYESATNEQLAALREHFLEWSGGFPPESVDKITVYLDYARESNMPYDAARAYLLDWYESQT